MKGSLHEFWLLFSKGSGLHLSGSFSSIKRLWNLQKLYPGWWNYDPNWDLWKSMTMFWGVCKMRMGRLRLHIKNSREKCGASAVIERILATIWRAVSHSPKARWTAVWRLEWMWMRSIIFFFNNFWWIKFIMFGEKPIGFALYLAKVGTRDKESANGCTFKSAVLLLTTTSSWTETTFVNVTLRLQ